jgi:hypothetical protein
MAEIAANRALEAWFRNAHTISMAVGSELQDDAAVDKSFDAELLTVGKVLFSFPSDATLSEIIV